MPYRVAPIAVLLTASTIVSGYSIVRPSAGPELTVHEWGTFTSVAGEDGRAQQWIPRQAPSELPCFVERLPLNVKGYLPGTVRMETPVLYFYAPAETSVDVRVRFRQGVVTEWYPTARVTPAALDLTAYRRADFEGSIAWSGVTVSPAAAARFATEAGRSHYYQARDTDAAPLQVGPQAEKFLFYRGVGLFPPPIEARLEPDGRVSLRTPAGGPIGDVVIFENRGGLMGYDVHHATTDALSVDLPTLDDASAFPGKALEDLLVAHGLYRREAAAMVATWRDSWFEEGTRLFYLMPQAAVDDILPLEVHPAPSSIVRAFVGRIEIVTPVAIESLRHALAAGDMRGIARFGRFLQPIADRILARTPGDQRTAFERRLAEASAAAAGPAPACR
jgi:hypothetical protein